MSPPILTDIFIYPVKSLAGIRVSNWAVNNKGLLHDRKWMLIDSHNQFLSQRKLPKMILIKTELTEDHLILSTQTSGSVSLPLFPDDGSVVNTSIWKDQTPAHTTNNDVNQWLTDFLETECQLVYQPNESIRTVDPDYALATDQIAFTDGFPFLITTSASLESLNQALDNPIPMKRFRPNLVISQCQSYAEDSWREISINNIHFRLPKPCSRCVVPTIDTKTAKTNKEPLTTLNRLRKWNKHVYFGQNALHNSIGELSIGNTVEIIQTGPKQPPI